MLYGVYGPEDADTVLCWYVPYRSELSSRFGVPCHTNQTSMRHIVKTSSYEAKFFAYMKDMKRQEDHEFRRPQD